VEKWIADWPVWVGWLVLFAGAFLRGGATYAVGRGLRSGGERSRLASHLDRPLVTRAEGWVRRFGAPLVSVGFLTVGVQTAINAASGLLRMPMRRFIPALVVGAALWATLYLTVGLAVVTAIFGQIGWWWALIGILVVLVVVVASRRIAAKAR
jgi:membrane protein DedA with SNARE-associated domain